jgi:hypothetical protein
MVIARSGECDVVFTELLTRMFSGGRDRAVFWQGDPMRAEQDVRPADRFLIAWRRLSAKDAEAFVPSPSDAPSALAVVLGYCYADIPLPAKYDAPQSSSRLT